MTTMLAETRSTPEDVIRLENQGLYELVDGQLMEKDMSSLATKCMGLLVVELGIFLRQHPLGDIYPEQTFQCFPDDPELIRRPDIAFVAIDRLAGVSETGHVKIAPDLAIEVVSPTDRIYDLDEKLVDYRSAGVKLVWVVDPKWKIIRIHRPDGSVSELFEGDMLTGEPILPGFKVAVSALMPRQNS